MPTPPDPLTALRAQLARFGREQRGTGEVTATGIAPLDRLLPRGGFVRGGVVEWLSAAAGAGAATLAWHTVRQAARRGGTVVVVDRAAEFYPPALAAGAGVAQANLLLIRPRSQADEVWSWYQALRCPAVAAVIGWAESLSERDSRRLQLAAETGAGLGLLIRPAEASRLPCWADARLLVEPQPALGPRSRRWRVSALRCRGIPDGKTIFLESDDETGDVRAAPRVANPASPTRAQRA